MSLAGLPQWVPRLLLKGAEAGSQATLGSTAGTMVSMPNT